MKITFISDTHNLHDKLKIDPCDVLIHCGDVTTHGTRKELWEFLRWFEIQPATYKIFIGGNHDFCLDPEKTVDYVTAEDIENTFEFITYLCQDEVVIENIKFYGHPYTPRFGDWAFMLNDEEGLSDYNQAIPEDTDILITHGPPLGILDYSLVGEGGHTGSESLLVTSMISVKPKVHTFGHIHENYGIQEELQGTLFINAANHTWLWKGTPYCPPITVEYEKGGKCIVL